MMDMSMASPSASVSELIIMSVFMCLVVFYAVTPELQASDVWFAMTLRTGSVCACGELRSIVNGVSGVFCAERLVSGTYVYVCLGSVWRRAERTDFVEIRRPMEASGGDNVCPLCRQCNTVVTSWSSSSP